MSIETLSTRTVYENRWLRVREDAIRREDGSEGVHAVVEKRDAAVVVPWDGERVHLVGQVKHPIGRFCWEFPQGAIDQGEEPGAEEVARSELAQETGLRAGALRHLGRLAFVPGISAQWFDAWLATDLEPGEPDPDAEEVGLETRAVTPDEFGAMVLAGEIVDNSTVAAWALCDLHGVRPA